MLIMLFTYKRLLLDVSTMDYVDKVYTGIFDSKEDLYSSVPDAEIVDIKELD